MEHVSSRSETVPAFPLTKGAGAVGKLEGGGWEPKYRTREGSDGVPIN